MRSREWGSDVCSSYLFATEAARGAVVEDVSFEVPAGSTVGLVGESGCGKSVTAMTIMRLLSVPPARIESGRVMFGGGDLLRRSEEHTSELQSLMRISYAVFCLKKKKTIKTNETTY